MYIKMYIYSMKPKNNEYTYSDLIRILPIWVVYKWHFVETNAIYIGISSNYRKRIKDELLYYKSSLIREYIETTGCSYNITILHKRLTGIEASELERLEIQNYKNSGYTVLNRNKGGSLGKHSRANINHIKETILTCKSMYEFRTKYPQEYDAVKYNGLTSLLLLLPNYTPLVRRTPAQISNMTNEYIYECAKQCKSRSEFAKKYKTERSIAISRGIYYGDITKLYTCKKHSKHDRNLLTDKEIIQCILKYKSRRDLYIHHHMEYLAAKERGLLDQYMPLLTKLSDEDIKQLANKCNSKYDFTEHHQALYHEAIKRGIEGEILSKLPTLRVNADHEYTNDELYDIASKCTSRTEFKTKYRIAYDIAYKRGIYHSVISMIPKQTGKHKNKS